MNEPLFGDDKPEDALEQSKPLKKLLQNLAQNYYEGDDGPVEIKWTDRTAHAKEEGGTPVVAVNVNTSWQIYDATGAHALRLLADTVSHEVQHHNDTEMDGKREFMEDFNDGYAKLAGMVVNVLEDNYIDHQRHQEYRGLKKIHKWQVQTQMSSDERRAPMGELDTGDQVVQGFMQVAFAGKVKGIADADPSVREMLAEIAPLCEQVKRAHDPTERKEIAREVTEALIDEIPPRPDLPDWLKEAVREALEEATRKHFDPDEAPADFEFDPDEMEEADEDEEADGPAVEAEVPDDEDSDDGETETREVRAVEEITRGRDATKVRIVK